MTDHIPLYPDEATIAVLVLGKRAKDWPRIAKYMEDKHGLPRVDELMGGRYWPAVEECFGLRQGYSALPRVDGSLCVPKTLSELMTYWNRLSWWNDRAVLFRSDRAGLAVQVEVTA
jgi:hypothetical protein